MTPSPLRADPSARATIDRRRFLGLALGAAVSGPALLGACGAGTDTSARVVRRHQDGILRIGVAGAPSNINPLDSGSELTRWLAEPIVETLYAYDADLRSVPLLAVGEPEVSADELTWTVRLRDDVTFHGGDPLTAHDVVASLDHILDLSSGSEWITYLLDYVQTFEALDDRTVAIGLVRPYGLLRSHLTNLPITHRDAVDRRDAIVGTGPYRLERFTPGQSFTLVRHPEYHGEPGAFEGIEFTVFTDGATRLVSLRQGKVDLITSVPYQNLRAVEGDDDLALVLADSPLDVLTYVNLLAEPFSDAHFRRAVALSMDRAGVRDRVFGGHATIGQGPIGPAERGWDPDLAVYDAEPDLDAARAELEQATTERRGFRITVGTSQLGKEIASVLAAGWATVGLDVEIEQLAGGPWSSAWLANEYELLMNTFQSGFTSGPANYLTLAPAHSRNLLSCGYADPELDGWLDRVWATDDDDERAGLLRQVSARLAEEAVMFPPVYPRAALAQRRELSPLDPEQLRISRLAPHELRFTSS
ncbi:MAG: ABC transporter substrate-binding protein [Acidimicrobiales bacterium]